MNRLEIEVANRGDITTIDGFLNKRTMKQATIWVIRHQHQIQYKENLY